MLIRRHKLAEMWGISTVTLDRWAKDESFGLVKHKKGRSVFFDITNAKIPVVSSNGVESQEDCASHESASA